MVRATIVTESRFESMDSEVLSSDNTATKEGMVKATAEAKQNLDPIIVVVDSEEELVRTTFTVKELAEGDSKTKNSSNRVAGQSMLQLVSVEEKVDKVVAVGTTIGFDFSKGERILGPLLLEGKRRTMQDTMLSLYGWRCRAKLAVRGTPMSPLIGLYQEGTHNVADIPDCKAHHPGINAAVELLRQGIKELNIEPMRIKGQVICNMFRL
ncbi:hypothetical protein QYF36_009775 [Acer negundo]|nr:hypothetical protein QYF36_009775 [Acer negundo]